MDYVGVSYTGMTSPCSSLLRVLHKTKSIHFTLPDNCNGISESLASTTVLEELVLVNGSGIGNHTTVISGINRNRSIKKLKFYEGQLHHQTLTDLVKVNKTITDLDISNVDVSPSECLLLAGMLMENTSIKEVRIWSSDDKKLDQSLVSQFLRQLKHNHSLEVLKLRVTSEARDNDQFNREVEMLVKDINSTRQSNGVIIRLRVELY